MCSLLPCKPCQGIAVTVLTGTRVRVLGICLPSTSVCLSLHSANTFSCAQVLWVPKSHSEQTSYILSPLQLPLPLPASGRFYLSIRKQLAHSRETPVLSFTAPSGMELVHVLVLSQHHDEALSLRANLMGCHPSTVHSP